MIDRSGDWENAYDLIRFNRESDSNETNESETQNKNADGPKISTLEGITIEESAEKENAFESIRCNREFDSNESDERARQAEKHDGPRIST
jgi:hypothetical protein